MGRKVHLLEFVICLAVLAAPAGASGNGNQLIITEAVANTDEDLLTVAGRNFGTGEPTVQLASWQLALQSYSDEEIVAELPVGIAPGTYALLVSRGSGPRQRDSLAVTIGVPETPGDITAVLPGDGLAGGGVSGDVALEIDAGYFDGLYARLDGGNTFAGDNFARTFIAEHDDESPSIQGRNYAAGFGIGVLGEAFGTDGIALYGRSYSPSGHTLGLHAVVHSPDGTAAMFHNEADGRILSAGTPTYGEVMSLEANGQLNIRQVTASSDFVPGPNEQIFIIDGSASATSGHVRAINGTTFSPDSTAVVGSAQPASGGIGGFFDSYGVDGLGVGGLAQATSGFSNGVLGETYSPDGVGGWFINGAGGRILLGSSDQGEVFWVEGDGSVRSQGTVAAAAFTDLAGNPIGGGGGIATSTGLFVNGAGELELDLGFTDGRYPIIDQENFFGAKQYIPDLAVSGGIDAARIHTQNDDPASFVIDGLSLAGSGQTRAINGTILSPEGIAVAGHVDAAGQPGGGAGVVGTTSGHDGAGVIGAAFDETGPTVGVYGEVASPNGTAIRAVSNPADGQGGQAMSGEAEGSWGRGVIGTANHPDFGVGVQGNLNGAEGYALYGFAPAGSGNTRAVFAEVFSPTGTSGYFVNGGGGRILSGHTAGEALVFAVEGNGDVYASSYLTFSSRAYKDNVHDLDGALDKVGKLRGVTFDWKSTGRADIGLIAEEVAEVVPEVVQVDPDGLTGVDYARLTALLIEAVNEQQGLIDELRSEIGQLRSAQAR